MAKKYYVVTVGRQCGVFKTWDECGEQVLNYPNAVHKSFTIYEDAMAYWDGHLQRQRNRVRSLGPHQIPMRDNVEVGESSRRYGLGNDDIEGGRVNAMAYWHGHDQRQCNPLHSLGHHQIPMSGNVEVGESSRRYGLGNDAIEGGREVKIVGSARLFKDTFMCGFVTCLVGFMVMMFVLGYFANEI